MESNLPAGWHYSKFSDIDTAKIPTGLTTLNKCLEYIQKIKIDSVIQEQEIYSWCIPVAFAESTEYYVITSPCCVHSSSAAERGMEVNSVIAIIKEYIEKQGKVTHTSFLKLL